MNKKVILPIIVLILLSSFVSAVYTDVYETDFSTDDWTDVGTKIYVDTGNSRLHVELDRSETNPSYSYKAVNLTRNDFYLRFNWTTPSIVSGEYGSIMCLSNTTGTYNELQASGEGICFQRYSGGSDYRFVNLKTASFFDFNAVAGAYYYIDMIKVADSDDVVLRVHYSAGNHVLTETTLDVSTIDFTQQMYLISSIHPTTSAVAPEITYIDSLILKEHTDSNISSFIPMFNTDEETNKGNYSTYGVTGQYDIFEDRQFFDFDGVNDYIIADNSVLSTVYSNNEMTINTWVKLSPTSTTGSVLRIGGNVLLIVNSNGASPCPNEIVFATSSSVSSPACGGNIKDGEWHMVTATATSTTATIYVDGVEIDSDAETLSGSASEILSIGSSTTGSTNFLNGGLDNMVIYNKTLNETEVAQLYNGESVETDRIVFKNYFNDLTDLSGNFNDATAVNGVSIDDSEQAFDFDGVDDYVYVEDFSYNPQSFTHTMWFKTDTTAGDKVMASARTGANGNQGFEYNIFSNTLRYSLIGSSTHFHDLSFSDTSNWHQVGISYDGNNVSFYMDGVLINSSLLTTTIAVDELWFGSREGSLDWGGLISDSIVFNESLTPSDLTSLYNEGRNYNPISEPIPGIFDILRSTYGGLYFNSFNVTVDGTTYQTTTGSVKTTLHHNHTTLENIFVSSIYDNVYFTNTYYNVNLSTDFTFGYAILNASMKEQPYDTFNDTFALKNANFEESTNTGNIFLYTNNGSFDYTFYSEDAFYINKSSNITLTDGLNNLVENVTSALIINEVEEQYYTQKVLDYQITINGTTYQSDSNGVVKTLEANTNLRNYSILIESNNMFPSISNISILNDLDLENYNLTNKVVTIKNPEGIVQSAYCYYNGSDIGVLAYNYLLSTYQVSNLTFGCYAISEYNQIETVLTDDNTDEVLNLERNQFLINFYDEDWNLTEIYTLTTSHNSEGEMLFTTYYTTTNISHEMIDFLEGRVNIDFGYDWNETSPNENGTVQRFQFYNNPEIEMNYDIIVFDEINEQVFLEIKDENNKFITEGYVMVYIIDKDDLDNPQKLTGRYLLNNLHNGLTTFYIDNKYTYQFNIYSDGYNTIQHRYNSEENINSITEPLTLIMNKDKFPENDKINIFADPIPLNLDDESFLLTVYGGNLQKVYITSDYITANSGEEVTVIYDETGTLRFNEVALRMEEDIFYGDNFFKLILENGTHYNVNSGNVTLELWGEKELTLDEADIAEGIAKFFDVEFYKVSLGFSKYITYIGTINVPVNSYATYDPLEEIEKGDTNIPLVMGLILLVIVSILIGHVIQNEERNTGKYTFMVGLVVLSGLFPQMILAGGISVVYFMGIAARRFY